MHPKSRMPGSFHAPVWRGNWITEIVMKFSLSLVSLFVLAACSAQAAAPTVFIRTPTNNAVFAASPSLTLISVAADSDGTVTNLEYYQGATRIAQTANSSSSVVWSNV